MLMLFFMASACGRSGESRLVRLVDDRCRDLDVVLQGALDRIKKGEEPMTGVVDLDSDPMLNIKGQFDFCVSARSVPEDAAGSLRVRFARAREAALPVESNHDRGAAVREMMKLAEELNSYPVRR